MLSPHEGTAPFEHLKVSLTRSHTHTLTHSHTHTLTLLLTHSHTHTRTLTLTHSHTHAPRLRPANTSRSRVQGLWPRV